MSLAQAIRPSWLDDYLRRLKEMEMDAPAGWNPNANSSTIPEIPRELAALATTIANLATRVQELEDKLGPVLTPPTPHEGKMSGSVAREAITSGLATELADQSMRVNNIERQVMQLIYRTQF